MVKLMPVIPSVDTEFLWEIMEERLSEPHSNISHIQMPTREQHEAFVRKMPYKGWFVVGLKKPFYYDVGVTYITHKNELGIYIKQSYRRQGIGSATLDQMIDKYGQQELIANINPMNDRSIRLFEGKGFKFKRNEDIQLVFTRDPSSNPEQYDLGVV